MMSIRVTKQQFVDTFLARYKRVYNHRPSERVVKDVITGYKMQYDVLEIEGFVVIDKQALEKVLKSSRENCDLLNELRIPFREATNGEREYAEGWRQGVQNFVRKLLGEVENKQ